MDRCIVTKVFCKTDLFPFGVISLPFLESNLDRGLCYRVFYGQVIRFQRLCTFRSGFEERTKFLADILILRGYGRKRLGLLFCKAVEKYIGEFQKWALPINFSLWFSSILVLNTSSVSQDNQSGVADSSSQLGNSDINSDSQSVRLFSQSVSLNIDSGSQSGSLVSQSVSLNDISISQLGSLFSQSV